MTGMAAIGTALVLGIGLRVAADSGALIMALMWLAEFPLARFTTTGESSGSTNPITDRHLIYAVVLVVLAAAYTGTPGASDASGPGCPSSSATGG